MRHVVPGNVIENSQTEAIKYIVSMSLLFPCDSLYSYLELWIKAGQSIVDLQR